MQWQWKLKVNLSGIPHVCKMFTGTVQLWKHSGCALHCVQSFAVYTTPHGFQPLFCMYIRSMCTYILYAYHQSYVPCTTVVPSSLVHIYWSSFLMVDWRQSFHCWIKFQFKTQEPSDHVIGEGLLWKSPTAKWWVTGISTIGDIYIYGHILFIYTFRRDILLIDGIHPANQLIGSLSQYLHGFIHPGWCRVSSINSIFVATVHLQTS